MRKKHLFTIKQLSFAFGKRIRYLFSPTYSFTYRRKDAGSPGLGDSYDGSAAYSQTSMAVDHPIIRIAGYFIIPNTNFIQLYHNSPFFRSKALKGIEIYTLKSQNL